MNVKNRKCIRKLSLKSLYANRRRNLIAIFAIALTTLLFTSMFTIVLSLNASYETYQFRQVGGYAHGTFKDVSPEQAERIAAHPKVKAAGVRKVIGITAEGVFAKIPAEISYMDANCTKWSYATPTTGRMPESGKEVAMDTAALQLLGVTPELGAEVTVSYSITDKDQTAFTVTDTFTLVGYWDYDELMPVHYINISRDYADDIEAQAVKTGLQPFRTDLNVMMASSTNIQGQMEQVDTDLGYTWDSYTDPNSVRIGVNWGYTSSQLESKLDPELVIAIAAFLLLVIFTGYLIIYNIFQISVVGDIRFYGLLKTIGTTPRQLKRIIRQQALLLCLIGIPAGLLLGYGIGAVLVPVVLHSIQLDTGITTISTSPVIFLGSMLFALLTVLLSCSKPGKMAAKVSPVEATKYTDVMQTKKKRRSIRGAKLHQMAFANLGRNKKKTVLVGTGCGVPGVMASRTIENERDRRMTIMTTCFIPCGAKMPIIGLIAGAMFGGSSLVAVSAYFIGMAAIICSGVILKKTKLFAGDPAPFVMELPAYHVPAWGNVFRATWERGWSFIKRAGSVILAATVVLWFLQGFGFENGAFGMVEDQDNSVLAAIATKIAWIFAPLGFGNWRATVASVSGLIAKENVVGTFGVLYHFGGELSENGDEIWAAVAQDYTALSAYAFMIFNLLCAPCFAAMGAIKREMNNGKWTAIAIGYMCALAYCAALVVYQIGGLITGEVGFNFFTIVAIVIFAAFLYLMFRPNKYVGDNEVKIDVKKITASK